MLLKNSINDLKKVLTKDNILFTEEERYCYAEDSANMSKSTKLPDIVVFAETIEDVQNIVKYASIHNIPIISRGAGTNMVGSCVCTEGGIVLNFSKMNKILEFNPDDMTMRVQPGVVLADIKNMAESAGLFLQPPPGAPLHIHRCGQLLHDQPFLPLCAFYSGTCHRGRLQLLKCPLRCGVLRHHGAHGGAF